MNYINLINFDNILLVLVILILMYTFYNREKFNEIPNQTVCDKIPHGECNSDLCLSDSNCKPKYADDLHKICKCVIRD